jgi:acylphosphatase
MIKKRISALVQGRVQGVGFRYFTRDRAQASGLTGWVRNLLDGNVEFEAQGAGRDVDVFVAEIRKGPGLSYVENITINELPVEEREEEFEIRF